MKARVRSKIVASWSRSTGLKICGLFYSRNRRKYGNGRHFANFTLELVCDWIHTIHQPAHHFHHFRFVILFMPESIGPGCWENLCTGHLFKISKTRWKNSHWLSNLKQLNHRSWKDNQTMAWDQTNPMDYSTEPIRRYISKAGIETWLRWICQTASQKLNLKKGWKAGSIVHRLAQLKRFRDQRSFGHSESVWHWHHIWIAW